MKFESNFWLDVSFPCQNYVGVLGRMSLRRGVETYFAVGMATSLFISKKQILLQYALLGIHCSQFLIPFSYRRTSG